MQATNAEVRWSRYKVKGLVRMCSIGDCCFIRTCHAVIYNGEVRTFGYEAY